MSRKHHIQDTTTRYGFTLEYVERQETNLDGLRDWYKWNSDDGRFTVCCDDNTGAFASIVVRRGSDDGGLVNLEQIDAYIDELVVTRKAVQAIQVLFIDGWKKVKSKVDLDFALVRQFGENRLPAASEEFWSKVMKE